MSLPQNMIPSSSREERTPKNMHWHDTVEKKPGEYLSGREGWGRNRADMHSLLSLPKEEHAKRAETGQPW